MVEAGAHYQYMANTLQLNNGMGSFSDIGNMAGMAYTDWSWASLLVDLNNDGLKDILVSNGIKKDVDNNDYRNKVKNLGKNATAEALFQLSKDTPSQPISNYVFRNEGDMNFTKVTEEWGFDKPSFSNGMAYGDLDNDGDLDVVTNNIDDVAFVYENKANGNFLKVKYQGDQNNKFGLGARTIISYKDKQQVHENTVTRGFISSVEYGSFFGLGKETEIDKVEVFWPNGSISSFEDIQANATLIAKQSDAKLNSQENNTTRTFLTELTAEDLGIDFVHQENKYDEYQTEILLPHNVSQNGPFIGVGDVNSDGLQDVYFGGAAGQSGKLYIQVSEGKFVANTSQPWEKDAASEDLNSLFFDADGDGDQDLYITSGGSEFQLGNPLLQDRLYFNDGTGVFSKSRSALPNILQSSQTVQASDIDQDGDLDLFVGTRLIPGRYTFPATSYLLINNNGKFTEAKAEQAPALTNIGMVTDALFSDIDNDEDDDLIIIGEWMEVKVLLNTNGFFEDVSKVYGLDDTRGIWWTITASDLDGDGDDDYILGNLGKNNKFKASEEHPFKVYANDFDDNGTNDIVLAKYYKDDYVPVRGRECTSQQMPYVAEKFEDYHSFASSKLVDILPEEKVEDAVVYEIKSFESIMLINEDGKLRKKSLPNEVQISPIKSILVKDVNADGHKDIITVGNHYGVEVETTRYDAGYGAVLLSDGNNNYKFSRPQSSGFYVPYDSRDIVMIDDAENKESHLILVANNNRKPTLYKITK
ncbi:MAG: hypothetical protein HKN99_08635 [Winogradskyella sp.]|nr:hypothetical protein [Winogradskyella sp.]